MTTPDKSAPQVFATVPEEIAKAVLAGLFEHAYFQGLAGNMMKSGLTVDSVHASICTNLAPLLAAPTPEKGRAEPWIETQEVADLREAARIVDASAASAPNYAERACLRNRLRFLADKLGAAPYVQPTPPSTAGVKEAIEALREIRSSAGEKVMVCTEEGHSFCVHTANAALSKLLASQAAPESQASGTGTPRTDAALVAYETGQDDGPGVLASFASKLEGELQDAHLKHMRLLHRARRAERELEVRGLPVPTDLTHPQP